MVTKAKERNIAYNTFFKKKKKKKFIFIKRKVIKILQKISIQKVCGVRVCVFATF